MEPQDPKQTKQYWGKNEQTVGSMLPDSKLCYTATEINSTSAIVSTIKKRKEKKQCDIGIKTDRNQ